MSPPHIQYSHPQQTEGGIEPTFDDEDFVIGAMRSSVEYVAGTDRNSVDFEIQATSSGSEQTFNDENYIIDAIQNSVEYVTYTERNSVDFEENT